MTLTMVTMVVKMRKPRSGRNFTKRMPKNAPISTKGMAQAARLWGETYFYLLNHSYFYKCS